jgi:PilZ domain
MLRFVPGGFNLRPFDYLGNTMPRQTIQGLRQFVRIPFSAPVQLVVQEVSHSVTLVDIALKGALVQCDPDSRWTLNAACRLVLPMAHDGEGITMAGRIAHLQDDWVGIECKDIDVTSLTRLRRLLELNSGDVNLMHREIQTLFRLR